jgi:quercetin dioxygenase-like cupin family protein
MSDDALDVERLARSDSPTVARRTIELAPHSVLDDEDVNWEQAIVFVTAGEIELVCSSGARARFRCGDILSFAPFPNRTVRNDGVEPARLLAIWRRPIASESAG